MKMVVVAVVGGTGHLGAAIGRRLALAGYQVIVGSREADGAREAAAKLSQGLSVPIRGAGIRITGALQ
jgi:predicted dinucleotide-binding enzyme